MRSPEGIIGQSEINLRSYLAIIWRRKWIVLLIIFLVTTIAIVVSNWFVTPKYQASTELLQQHSGLDKALLGSDLFQQDTSQPEREMQTASEMITSPKVVEAVNNELGGQLGGQDPSSFVSVSVVNKADIVRITATNTDPELAAAVANSFGNQYINWRRQVERDVLQMTRSPIEAQIEATPVDQRNTAAFQVLQDKLQTLKVLETMQIGDLEIIKPAEVPAQPSSPQPVKTGLIAFFTSLIVGVGVVFMVENLDTRLRDPEEISSQIDKPVLASIPGSHPGQNGQLATLAYPSGAASEAFRLLKTNLSYVEPDREIKTIMVTSPGSGEGKSTTVANLAVTLARAGKRVIIFEADFRRPSLSKYLGIDNSTGLTNAISGEEDLRQVLQVIEANDLVISNHDSEFAAQTAAPAKLNGIKPIYCATSGPLPPNPGELVASDKLKSLIDEAREHVDVVLIDAPPVGVVGDAASIASKVDGYIFVVQLAKTVKNSAGIMADFIASVPSNALGIVVTNANAGARYSYCGKYGGYGYY